MKVLSFKILIISLLIIVTAIGLNIWYKSISPDEAEPIFFTRIDDSKSYGTFLAEYRPIENKIKLRYHSDSIEFIRLWTDAIKNKEKVYLGKGIKRKAVAHQFKVTDKIYFQIDYRQFPADDYVFQIEGHNGRNGKGILDVNFLPDTLVFDILEKNPVDSIGWNNFLTGQKISFVRIEE